MAVVKVVLNSKEQAEALIELLGKVLPNLKDKIHLIPNITTLDKIIENGSKPNE
jgi:hypothetical protein